MKFPLCHHASAVSLYWDLVATMATIIASQALISGTFSLINEAISSSYGPRCKCFFQAPPADRCISGHELDTDGRKHPGDCDFQGVVGDGRSLWACDHGQHVDDNFLAGVLFHYGKEVAFSIRTPRIRFLLIGRMFLVSTWTNSSTEAGHISDRLHSLCGHVYLHKARRLRQLHTEFVDLRHYEALLQDLQDDKEVPKEATNLVYLAVADSRLYRFQYHLFDFSQAAKRADVYWFVHVETVDSPFTSKYSVDTIIPGRCFFVRIKLGFKVPHSVNLLFHKIVNDMADEGSIDLMSPYAPLNKHSMSADFKFVILHSWPPLIVRSPPSTGSLSPDTAPSNRSAYQRKKCMVLKRRTY